VAALAGAEVTLLTAGLLSGAILLGFLLLLPRLRDVEREPALRPA
jgi:hypothetical protein